MNSSFASVHTLPLVGNVSEVDHFRAARDLGDKLDNMLRGDTKRNTFRKELKQDIWAAFSTVHHTILAAMYMKAHMRLTLLSRTLLPNKEMNKALRIGASVLLELHDEACGTSKWFHRSGSARAASVAKLVELEARLETVLEMESLLERKVCVDLRAIRENTDNLASIAHSTSGMAQDMVALNTILAPAPTAAS